MIENEQLKDVLDGLRIVENHVKLLTADDAPFYLDPREANIWADATKCALNYALEMCSYDSLEREHGANKDD